MSLSSLTIAVSDLIAAVDMVFVIRDSNLSALFRCKKFFSRRNYRKKKQILSMGKTFSRRFHRFNFFFRLSGRPVVEWQAEANALDVSIQIEKYNIERWHFSTIHDNWCWQKYGTK